MKRTMRYASLVLAVLTVLLCFSACAQNGSDTPVTTPVTAAPTVDTPEDTAERLSIPDDVDLGGETMGVLYWSDVENPEFFIEDADNIMDKTQDAINRRNKMLEERMKVKLDFIGQEGRNSKLKEFVSYINASIGSGDHAFDIIAGYSQSVANAAYNSFCYDLAKTEHLDLEKPWWPSLLTSEATVNGKLYFVSGDISTNMLYMMYTVFFNKDLLETKTGSRSPYDMINANEWTVDNMIAMCQDFYRDTDADMQKSAGDQYGLVLPKLSLDAFFYGSGLRTTDRDANGLIQVADSYFSEKSAGLLEKLERLCYDSDDGYWKGKANVFSAGRSVFYCDRAVAAIKNLADVEFGYGVVPAPKWSSDQEAYYTCAGNPFMLYAVVADCTRPDLASAVLECWAYEAYNYTTPAIFEVTMKIRFAKDSETAKMYDLIRDGVTFDLGRIYGITLNDMTQTLYRDAMDNRSDWLRTKVARTKMLKSLLEGVNAAYTK